MQSWVNIDKQNMQPKNVNKYYAREKPYIDYALKQEGIPLKTVFRRRC